MEAELAPCVLVTMTEEYKTAARGKCGEAGRHLGPFDPGEGDDPGGDCWGCSTAHVEEFGDCVGVVQGLTDYNNRGEPYDPAKVGPEVDVRWQPSNLRYAYDPRHLMVVAPDKLKARMSPATGTKEQVLKAVRKAIGCAVAGFVDEKPDAAVERFRKTVTEVMKGFAPAWSRVEVLEEDDDTKVVREIMEEPNDVIQMRVTLPVPIDYVRLTVKVGL